MILSAIYEPKLFLQNSSDHPPYKLNKSHQYYEVPDTFLDSDTWIRQALSDFKNRECNGFEQRPAYLLQGCFKLSLPCSYDWFSKLNWCHIFALMWALPPTLWVGRVAGVAPETLLCESLQPCVKGKHVLHSESQGSLSRLISEMKCFPPPALTIEASALAQTNPSRVVCTWTPSWHSAKRLGFFIFFDKLHFECFLFGLLITAMLGNMWCMCVPFTH